MKKKRFGTIDLFLQVDNTDKILDEVFQIAGELKMKPFLLWGLCLGFVKNGAYLKGDNDLDIGVICNGKKERQTLTAVLAKKGFIPGTPCRHHNIHYRKNKVLVDIYFLESAGFYSSFDSVRYKGKAYSVPHPIKDFLSACYSNWESNVKEEARYVGSNDENISRKARELKEA